MFGLFAVMGTCYTVECGDQQQHYQCGSSQSNPRGPERSEVMTILSQISPNRVILLHYYQRLRLHLHFLNPVVRLSLSL